MLYSTEFETVFRDVDCRRQLSATAMMAYIQEAANRQMRDETPSYNQIFDSGYAFLLNRFSIRMFDSVYQDEHIRIVAWPGNDSRGTVVNRYARMYRGDKLLAESVGVWALLGIEDKRLHRTDVLDLSRYTFGDAIDISARMRIPADTPMERVGEKQVLYADTDCNGHMTNCRYPELFCDHIPEIFQRNVREMTLHFIAEAPLGESIEIFRSPPQSLDGGGLRYYFKTKKGEASNVEAVFLLD